MEINSNPQNGGLLADFLINVITYVILNPLMTRMIMMTALKLKAVGNSTGVILPKEILSRLHVEKGDSLFVVETPNGIELTPYDPEFEQQMEAARKIMKKRRAVLRELAK